MNNGILVLLVKLYKKNLFWILSIFAKSTLDCRRGPLKAGDTHSGNQLQELCPLQSNSRLPVMMVGSHILACMHINSSHRAYKHSLLPVHIIVKLIQNDNSKSCNPRAMVIFKRNKTKFPLLVGDHGCIPCFPFTIYTYYVSFKRFVGFLCNNKPKRFVWPHCYDN